MSHAAMKCGATTPGLLHLTSAEATGPEDLRHNATARGLVSGLLKRARPTYAPQVRACPPDRTGLLTSRLPAHPG